MPRVGEVAIFPGGRCGFARCGRAPMYTAAFVRGVPAERLGNHFLAAHGKKA